MVQRNNCRSTCISRNDSTTGEPTDKRTRGETKNRTTGVTEVSDICTGDTMLRIRNPRSITSRSFEGHSFKTNRHRSKSETPIDATIGAVDAAQMLTSDVRFATTNDTNESSIEPVDGSLTGYVFAAPEVNIFDELSSSSSGPGFISAEHFISSLLRDEDTSSVSSNEASSTPGETCEGETSPECESCTTDRFDESTVSVAPYSQEDAVNIRPSDDIDRRPTGFNACHEVATLDAGTNTFPMTSPGSSCRDIHACNDIARKSEKRNIIRNRQVSSDEDVNDCDSDNCSDQLTPSSHSSGNALQGILEMARSCMASDSETDVAPLQQSHSDRSRHDEASRITHIDPTGGRGRAYVGARLKQTNGNRDRSAALFIGRCSSEPTLRSTAGRPSTMIASVGGSSSSCQNSRNSGFSASRNSCHAYRSEYAQTDKGTPNRSVDKLAENPFVYSATTSTESCLENDSTNSLSDDENPECLQLTQPADSFGDSVGAYDDWSSKRTWMLTVDEETIGTNSYESFEVYNDDDDTRQGFGQHHSYESLDMDRIATDFKQMLYLLPTMRESHNSRSFSDLNDSSTTHEAGSSRSTCDGVQCNDRGMSNGSSLTQLAVPNQPTRSETCIGSKDNTSCSIATLVNVSTCEVSDTASVSSATSSSDLFPGNDDDITLVECQNDACTTCDSSTLFETTTTFDDIHPVNITVQKNVSKYATGTDMDGGNTNRNNPAPDHSAPNISSDNDSSNIDTDLEQGKKRSKKHETKEGRVTAVSGDGTLKTQIVHNNTTPEDTPYGTHAHRSPKSKSRKIGMTQDVLPSEQSAYVVARYNQDMFYPVGPADTQVLLPRPTGDDQALMERGEGRHSGLQERNHQRGYYR